MVGSKKGGGLETQRYFSKEGKDPYDSREWREAPAKFGDFQQENVLFPVSWSELAKGTAASKYFYGELGTDEREYSAKQLISRVTGTMAEWFSDQGYVDSPQDAEIFRDELAELALDQRSAFNSPVWFNVGLHLIAKQKSKERKSSYIIGDNGKAIRIHRGREYESPQTSACFIQGVRDTMEDIMALTTNEAMLFKYGSGTGTDLSTLRSSREKLSGGGVPSGPMAYLMYMSRVAGIVRSGGKTRRAAKMNSLRTDHPDIKEFIEAKSVEKRKAMALVKAGYDPLVAMETVAYQNVNLSVRVTDDFMEAALSDEEWQTIPVHNKELIGTDRIPVHKAKDLLGMIAEGTRFCGDPGVQYHTTINKWHTCPESGEIMASNPCSEYMFVNDSSCNLASHNLMKFRNSDGSFDWKSFGHAAKRVAYAQDAIIDKSSYPKKSIAENSHKYRPLGQGYANLGALVMSWGLPYDSDEARTAAAIITAYQTGKVYEASTEMSERLGAFEEFEKNKKPMLKVMGMHQSALDDVDRSKIPQGLGLEEMLDEAYGVWDNVIKRGKKHGFRNAQATVLAPTGTIGFLMDCDTTGVEPDLALVKYKQLFDGGKEKIVNQSVSLALDKLGYGESQIEEIVSYLNKNETIEGAPGLKDDHLDVFDCALSLGGGEAERYIAHTGHVDMMGAVQPFLSGAISKTVNVPKDVTAEEIEQIYINAWKKGIKAVAVYRDGSHVLQPLTAGKGLEGKLQEHPVAVRRKLPGDRPSKTHKFNIAGHEGYLIKGEYPGEGRLGETFITMSREGSTIGGLMDGIATLTSIALQHGIPLETLVGKFKGQKFDPRGMVLEGDSEIKTATSITDYIFRHLGNQYLEGPVEENGKTMDNGDETPEETEDKKKEDDYDWSNIPSEERGGFCPTCGDMMRKVGHCSEICRCGHKNTNGCGE